MDQMTHDFNKVGTNHNGKYSLQPVLATPLDAIAAWRGSKREDDLGMRFRLFVSLHLMNNLLVYGLAISRYTLYFKCFIESVVWLLLRVIVLF